MVGGAIPGGTIAGKRSIMRIGAVAGNLAMQCYIYKSLKKADTYLYVRTRDGFDPVPDVLRNLLGRLQFVMELDLGARDSLANADPAEVIRLLDSQGYYLQLPPADYFGPVSVVS